MSSAPVASMTSRSKPRAMPAQAGRPCSRAVEEIFVYRVSLPVELPFAGLLHEKPGPLFGSIGQLAKGVGELQSADIDLEALGKAGLVRTAAR